MKSILIVEDDESINRMLCDLLKHHEYVPTQAYSGTEALMHFRHEAFDLILLDLMIPGKSGYDVLSEIRQVSGVPVIAVTALSDKENIVNILKNGANDYVTKPFDNDELLARIEVQLRSNHAQAPAAITFRDIVLDPEQYDGFIDSQPLQLSKREFDILKLFMESPRRVFTKNNLYESVWNDEFMGDDNTITVHMSKLRGKIARFRPNEEYIQTVWGIGYKMQDE